LRQVGLRCVIFGKLTENWDISNIALTSMAARAKPAKTLNVLPQLNVLFSQGDPVSSAHRVKDSLIQLSGMVWNVPEKTTERLFHGL